MPIAFVVQAQTLSKEAQDELGKLPCDHPLHLIWLLALVNNVYQPLEQARNEEEEIENLKAITRQITENGNKGPLPAQFAEHFHSVPGKCLARFLAALVMAKKGRIEEEDVVLVNLPVDLSPPPPEKKSNKRRLQPVA